MAWHETIEVKAVLMVERLPASFLTYAITWVMNPCFANMSLTYKAIALLVVFTISKNPMVMWHGSHWSFKKCTIVTKVSTLTLDIHRWKETMQEWQNSKDQYTYLSLVNLAILGKMSFTKICLDGKLRREFCFKINLVKKKPSTKYNNTNSLAMNNVKSSSNSFWIGSSLEYGVTWPKK
jgi:hypothetical protein